MNENDIYNLQIKISHLESFIWDLNEVVIEQNECNVKLQREMSLLKDKVYQLEERLENKQSEIKHDEAPPHY